MKPEPLHDQVHEAHISIVDARLDTWLELAVLIHFILDHAIRALYSDLALNALLAFHLVLNSLGAFDGKFQFWERTFKQADLRIRFWTRRIRLSTRDK